jgi:hypothetical protein
MLVEEFMRFCERRMMSLERKGIKGRDRAAYNKGLRSIREPKKEKVTGDSRKYSLRISIFCAHRPRNCRVVQFKSYNIRRTCSTHAYLKFGRRFLFCSAEGRGPLRILLHSRIGSVNAVLCVRLSQNINFTFLYGVTPCSLVGGYQITRRIIPEEFNFLSAKYSTIWSILILTTLQHFLAVTRYLNLVLYVELNNWFPTFLLFNIVRYSVP